MVKCFFSSVSYHMCNIFVLILYIKNKVSLQFVLFFSRCVIIYLYLFFSFCFFLTPVRVFLGKLMCGYPRGLMRGTDLEFSGMSSKWFFACNVINVRLSSAHCITNQCYHSKFKCNHVQKTQTRTQSASLFSCCPGRDSGEKEKHETFFHEKIYKYLHSSQWKEECVYIF